MAPADPGPPGPDHGARRPVGSLPAGPGRGVPRLDRRFLSVGRRRLRLPGRRLAVLREPLPPARRMDPLPGLRPLRRRVGGKGRRGAGRPPPVPRTLPGPDLLVRADRTARLLRDPWVE